ncbi:MAG: acetyl-CoA carboxylase carboxyltransferase subunit alpha [Proteobacteria bacterium]|nr:acetyl-CoA carboxylase carboxyltransferase subunit alpha [Pseudomonadota bacterium]
MHTYLDFERPIADLESKIEELRHIADQGDLNITEEIKRLEGKVTRLLKSTYSSLTPWQKVLVARHPERPQFFDYLNTLFQNFIPLAGDRLFAEDKAIIGGLASFEEKSVMVIGQQKGKDTESRMLHNFGMAKPEGYRKAQRLMKLAEKFQLPLITFIDTSGAYPGVDAEERGQAEAIAKCLEVGLSVKIPILTIVIGEGGSGGAIALGTANTIFMLENAVYSVISPEGCASILWRSATKAPEAAEALRLTAQDLKQFNIIDEIIPEPLGGAHRDPVTMIHSVKENISHHLNSLMSLTGDQAKALRCDKFLSLGRF